MNWRHQAACRDHDPELWFSGKPYEQAAALAVCRSCPVVDECRAFADDNNRISGYPLQGIWGGKQYGRTSRPVIIMRGTATPTARVSHPECFGRFAVIALSCDGAIRKCMRRVAMMCARHSACERLDRQEARG